MDQQHNEQAIEKQGLQEAETMHLDLAAFSLTRDQVAERYAAAGFSVKPRTVSLYAKEGRLRAHKVEAKNGLVRYLFDPLSVDEDIAQRQHEAQSYTTPDPIYSTVEPARGNDAASSTPTVSAPSVTSLLHEKEVEIAVLKAELREVRQSRDRAEQRLEHEHARSLTLAQQLGEYKQRVAMIEAPKTEGKDGAPKPASFLHRLFGRKGKE